MKIIRSVANYLHTVADKKEAKASVPKGLIRQGLGLIGKGIAEQAVTVKSSVANAANTVANASPASVYNGTKKAVERASDAITGQVAKLLVGDKKVSDEDAQKIKESIAELDRLLNHPEMGSSSSAS